ncbi:MAG: tripartite tricarboxylate transporter substrate binding protein [Pseudomonadota bacterium]|nr:tripartite tricarboxylate transporter substrate binding protein [Pseudomonadota bacterium]
MADLKILDARRRSLLLLGAGVALPLAATRAATYPDKPIRIVVPWPPGGVHDILARPLAVRLQALLGQPVIIDNRGGGNGVIGADLVAKAPADGLTLMFHSVTSHVANPAIYPKLPYQTLADFAPIAVVAVVPMVVVANPSLPVKDLKELIALARQQPGRLSYASFGNGSPGHFAGELFKQKAGIAMVHIPYRGGGPALNDTVGGVVPLYFSGLSTSLQMIYANRLRALAVTGSKRSALLPEVPTVEEATGFSGYDLAISYALWAPAKTPAAIQDRLYRGVVQAMADPELRQILVDQGNQSTAVLDPAESLAFARSESVKWGRVAAELGIKAD